MLSLAFELIDIKFMTDKWTVFASIPHLSWTCMQRNTNFRGYLFSRMPFAKKQRDST
jgi:hypothetical protein